MVYQLILLFCFFSFYCMYFLKQLSLRKKGIDTNRLGKGRKPRRTQTIEQCLLVATYTTAVTQFLSIFYSGYMMGFDLPGAVRVAGVFAACSGVVFFLFAIVSMQENWRAGVDETQKTGIVSHGIYKYSRNPAFVGFDLLYIGTVLSFPNLIMALCAVLSIALLHLQILEEEKYLAFAFGCQYTEYKNKVPRYFLFL